MSTKTNAERAFNAWNIAGRIKQGMRRLYPESMLSQLILIFSGSFFTLLVLTSIYVGESRHFYFMRGLMSDRSRHMAETAFLLDMTPRELRFLLRDQFNNSGFHVAFVTDPPQLSVEDSELEEPSALMEYMLNFSLPVFTTGRCTAI